MPTTIEKPSKRVKKTPIEASLTCAKEYVSNGFNKTKAVMKATGQSLKAAQANCTRDFDRLMAFDGINLEEFKDFPLAKVDVPFIIGGLTRLSQDADSDADRIQSYRLLGLWRKLWSDAPQQTIIVVTPDAQKQINNIFQSDIEKLT